jgi:hypothetical protein
MTLRERLANLYDAVAVDGADYDLLEEFALAVAAAYQAKGRADGRAACAARADEIAPASFDLSDEATLLRGAADAVSGCAAAIAGLPPPVVSLDDEVGG